MSKRWLGVLVTVLIVAAAAGGVLAIGGSDDGTGAADGVPTDLSGPFEPRPGEGPEAPSFDLPNFEGEGRITNADFEGKPLVLNFWASWCPFCIDEMPAFEEVFQQFSGEVAFLGVNVQDERQLAKQLAEQTGVTYPLALDEDGSLLRDVQGRTMPTTLLISADGHVVHRFGGESTPADELTGLILEHLLRPA